MIVYNIEDFVIKQMFNPYQNDIVSDGIHIKECANALKKKPELILSILCKNRKAFNYVFNRLARIDFKFYKWLKHPLIEVINDIVMDFRMFQKCYGKDLEATSEYIKLRCKLDWRGKNE